MHPTILFYDMHEHDIHPIDHDPNDVPQWKLNRIKKRLLKMGYKSKFRTYEPEMYTITAENISSLLLKYEVDLYKAIRSYDNFILVIGYEQFEQLTGRIDAPTVTSIDVPMHNKYITGTGQYKTITSIYGMHTKVIPNFDGILIVPIDGSESKPKIEEIKLDKRIKDY